MENVEKCVAISTEGIFCNEAIGEVSCASYYVQELAEETDSLSIAGTENWWNDTLGGMILIFIPFIEKKIEFTFKKFKIIEFKYLENER